MERREARKKRMRVEKTCASTRWSGGRARKGLVGREERSERERKRNEREEERRAEAAK